MTMTKASYLALLLTCFLATPAPGFVLPQSAKISIQDPSTKTVNFVKERTTKVALSSTSDSSFEEGETTSRNDNSELVTPIINENFDSVGGNGRYDDLLSDLDLSSSVHARMGLIPPRKIRPDSDVFCNREMRMGALSAIGFDMDHTLVQYEQPAFDKLAFDGAKHKLHYSLGYPKEVLNFEYDHTEWIRGLIIDKKKGNFLKIDRHKYVRIAYHGFNPISSETRKIIYSRSFDQQPSFTEKDFVNMDTLFQHVDAHLFALLIEMKDYGHDYDDEDGESDFDSEFLDLKTYEEMFKDLRACVDLCHRDGVIKDVVAEDPERYIVRDDDMIPMLKNYKEAGVKVFLLTNSYWKYTSTAMNYLYHGKKVDADLQNRNEWLELFDIVVVGSCKPAYLKDPNLSLFRVNHEDGSLLNTEGVYEIEGLGPNGVDKFLSVGNTFQGGNWLHLQAMLETKAGEEILYVGDHLYGDVLRSKRALGWRTAFIVPELPTEMKIYRDNLKLYNQIIKVRKLRDELNIWADELRIQTSQSNSDDIVQKLDEIEEDDIKIKSLLSKLGNKYHAAFHPIWGQTFQAGYMDSRFSYYVQNYACVYMSKASNLRFSTTERSFRTSQEMMPHHQILVDPMAVFEED